MGAAFVMAALAPVSHAATVRRVAHTATLLATGDMLVTGGVDQTGATLQSADLVATSLARNVIYPIANMSVVRASHTATLMSNGCVFIAGGNTAASDVAAPTANATTEIFNPATSAFTAGPAMGAARYNHTSTLLNNGKVLICGGQDAAGNALASCELYTPTSCTAGSFGAAPTLLQARFNHTAVLLKDGRVWYAGGANPAITATGGYLATTERYDPNTNSFLSASPMIEARSQHTATLMGDGKALLVGGYNRRDVLANRGIVNTAEIYDPISNTVAPAASLTARRSAHAATLSANGSVDVFGGLGNITTTYLISADISDAINSGGSISFGAPVAVPTAAITGIAAQIPLDFLLSKPVVGEIADGEIWFSSPQISAAWGAIRFTPASETNPLVGLRVNLSGREVGCRNPVDPTAGVTGNCGNIVTVPGGGVSLTQASGQVVFYPILALTLGGNPVATSGNFAFAPGTIDSGNASSILTPAGSSFATSVLIPVNKAFIGKTLSGTFNLTAGSLVQPSSFTVTITSGGANIPATVVGQDALGNGQLTVALTFTGVEGTITYTGQAPQSFASGVSVPQSGAPAALTLVGNLRYTTNGADIAGESFVVDVATVVINKMNFGDHETYNPRANSWTILPADGVIADNSRFGQSATLMPNNDVVYYGGRTCVGVACTAQSIISLQTVYSEKNFTLMSAVAETPRAFHTSTLLPSGFILVAGGTNGPSILNSAEAYDPVNNVYVEVATPLRQVRDLHTATLLPNGNVLIAGGFTTNATSTGSTNSVELFYPDTGVFLETTPMISSRSNHTAIMLPDGRVFAAGGFGTNSALQNDVASDTAEIYVSTNGKWMAAANMPAGCERAVHAAVQLKDGRILLIGGVNASGVLDTTAAYTPLTNTWSCASVAAMPTPLRSMSATLLFDGRVLVAGGNDGLGEANKSFIYDPRSNTWTATDPLPLLQPRFNHTSTLLPNGNVMISGGSQRFGDVPASIEVFHVNASSWVTNIGVGGGFASGPRAFHTMTLALNNNVYAIGGSNGVVGNAGVALYDTVEAGQFSATPDAFTKNAPPSFRQSTINSTSASPFMPGTNLTVNGSQFRGGTEAAGGGAASQHSAFSYPHMVLQQVDGSGGGGSQANGGFAIDLTTQIFQNPANLATLDTSLTVALPPTTSSIPFGWYVLRTGANDLYSNGRMVQAGPAKPVAAPTGMAGVALGVSSMNWTWNAVAGVDGYNVYNATTGVFITTIPAVGSPSFQQTSLDPNSTCAILVAGYTLSGDGPLANSPTSYTLSTTPASVQITSVTFSDLILSWSFNKNSFPGTIYEVTQSSDDFVTDVSTPVPALFNLTTNNVVISNLTANTTYFFRVRAFNLVGLPSPYSVSVSTRTRAPVTQPIVSGRTTTSITWAWADPGSVTNYRVYNATNSVLLGVPVSNSFIESNLGTNTLHSIRVTAVTNAGEGPLSPSASAYTDAATPGFFNPPVSQLTTGSFLLNWSNNGNPLGTTYRIALTRFSPSGGIVSVTQSTAPALAFSQGFGTLVPSTLYSTSLVSVNGDGYESAPAVVNSTYTLPAQPTALTVTGTSPTSISVVWNANNNSSSATYQVTYSTDDFVNIVSTAISFSANYGGLNATILGLVTSATYSIRVIASNPYGQLSQFSLPVTTRTFNGGAPPGQIQGNLFYNGNSQIIGSLGNGRNIDLRAPAHAFPSDVQVTISSFTPNPTLCPGATNIAFSLTASPSLQPIGSIYFSFDFSIPELGTIPASRAVLLRYDPGSGTCVPLETTVDTVNNWMTARINHFSLFQVGQVPLSTSPESARIFPNPYYTARDGYVTIDNVPPNSRVRIMTLRGEPVLDTKANGNGIMTWSATNGAGRSVASGVYLVFIESGGAKKLLKLAVIR